MYRSNVDVQAVDHGRSAPTKPPKYAHGEFFFLSLFSIVNVAFSMLLVILVKFIVVHLNFYERKKTKFEVKLRKQ